MRKLVASCILLAGAAYASGIAAQDRPALGLSELRPASTRRLVRRALEQRAEVLDVEGSTRDAAGRASVVAAARADGLVVPSLSRRRRRRPELTLVLYGVGGDELARRSLALPRRRPERAIGAAVAGLLEGFRPRRAPLVEPAPAVAAAPVSAPEPSARSDALHRPYLRFHAGLSIRDRDLEVQADTSLRHSIPLYPELLVEGEVRPLGADDPWLYALRLRLRFAYALFFESATRAGQEVGGGAFSFGGDLAWLAPLGVVELGPVFGGGYEAYELQDNPILPSVGYAHLDARAALRIRALDEQLVLRAEVGYRFSAGSGPLTERLGSLEGSGVVVSGGIAGSVPLDADLGFDWGLDVDWQQSWLGFGGSPPGAPAASGLERFVRGRLTVGLALR